jgi:hypothetical protein
MKIKFVTVLVFYFSASVGYAQRATELYTPIGRSPGLSGTVTVIGTIESFEEASGTLEIAGETGPATVTVTERCRIYLDRSKLKERNLYGKSEDLKAGRRVEILYENRAETGKGPAEWIKVEMGEP